MTKKLTRGISKEFADAFKECELYSLYESHRNELFIGVRNDYLSVYHNCNSIAKVTYGMNGIRCEIDRYYLDGIHRKPDEEGKICKLEPKEICDRYEEIKTNSNKRATEEKKAQSKLVISNNRNPNSNWFCIDVEYVKSFRNQAEKDEAGFNARFDIIALSRKQPHHVALIELKYGSGAIGGKGGIYKHIGDFSKFRKKRFFETHLSKEIIEIIKSLHDLKIPLLFELPQSESELFVSPEFYVITLNNNAEKAGGCIPKQTMAGYLFKNKRWGCKRLAKYCVEEKFGDMTKKENDLYVTFLFSTETVDNITINDIIDDERYERP